MIYLNSENIRLADYKMMLSSRYLNYKFKRLILKLKQMKKWESEEKSTNVSLFLYIEQQEVSQVGLITLCESHWTLVIQIWIAS